MKVKLDIRNRIMTFGLLPETGNIQTVKMVRTLREDIGFSEEENEVYGIKINPQNGSYNWDGNKDEEKEFEIPELIVEVIKSTLKDLDAKGSLTPNHIDIYDIFVGE